MRVLFSVLFTLLTSIGFSQVSSDLASQFDNDFKLISGKLNNESNYLINTEYHFYNSHSSPQPLKVMQGYYKKKGANYKSMTMGILTIQEDKIKVFVDSANKTITLTDADKENSSVNFGVNITLLKQYCSNLLITDSSKANRTYRLNFKTPIDNIAFVEVVLDLNTKYLKKLTLFHSNKVDIIGVGNVNIDKPRTEVVFSKPIFQKNTDVEFSTSTFLSIHKDSIALQKGYSNYSFYNHLLQK